MKTKQVICIRRDLNMSIGKTAAQVAHAAMAFLTRNISKSTDHHGWEMHFGRDHFDYEIQVNNWLEDSFTKVCVFVDSQEELDEIYQKAKDAKLLTYKITDNGRTEFNGVATDTCVAIGPDHNEEIDKITGHLSTNILTKKVL